MSGKCYYCGAGIPSWRVDRFCSNRCEAMESDCVGTEVVYRAVPDLGLKIKKAPNCVKLPTRRRGDAAWDLYSTDEVIIVPGERKLIDTGVSVSFSEHFFLHILPRSGMAVKDGIDVMAGVVDSSYTGPVKVVLVNHSRHRVVIARGDKIAQMAAIRIEPSPDYEVVEELDETERGGGGFGSTGR